MKKSTKIIGGLLVSIGLLSGCSSEETKVEPTKQEVIQLQKPYVDEIKVHAGEITDLIEQLGGQIDLFTIDPSITSDSDWMIDTATVLYDLQVKIDEVKAMEDIPEGLEGAHEKILDSMDSLQYVATYTPDGFVDNETMVKVGENITESMEQFSSALEEMEELGHE